MSKARQSDSPAGGARAQSQTGERFAGGDSGRNAAVGDPWSPVGISPPIDGAITLWTPDGRRMWRTEDSEGLRAVLGRGPLNGRWPGGARRQDKVAAGADGTLQVLVDQPAFARFPSNEENRISYRIFLLDGEFIEPAWHSGTEEHWMQFCEWLAEVIEFAVDRDDDVSVVGTLAAGTDRCSTKLIWSLPHPTIEAHTGGSATQESASAGTSRDEMTQIADDATSFVRCWAASPLDTQVVFTPANRTSRLRLAGTPPRSRHWARHEEDPAERSRLLAGSGREMR